MVDTNLNGALVAARKATAEEYEKRIGRLVEAHEQEKQRLNVTIAERDATIEALRAEIAQLGEVAKLKSNLFALSDTFHIAAERIAETEDPVEEANTLHELANQFLTVVGLPPRDLKEFKREAAPAEEAKPE